MDLTFTNRFTNELPADPSEEVRPRQVHQACFSRVLPTPTSAPSMVATSIELATELGLAEDLESSTFLNFVTGNHEAPGMDAHAMCYGGHQFGNWAGQLGDGRAIALGEILTPSGDHQTLQLKGSGPTPYSRGADGYAVLRSSVREFLCSEAMHHLGVPTTRALTLARTGDDVVRDMLYDGHPAPEPGAIVCRVAPSFLRFGSYELFPSRGELDELRDLVNFTIRHHFPHLGEPSAQTYVAWFREVAEQTADLVVDWMRVGFVHGVMNTDNLSILGLTIDYGPYGWLEDYDPDWTPNTTDKTHRRYRFGSQAQVAQWNLSRLGNAIYALVEEAKPLEAVINDFVDYYQTAFRKMMAAKLGLPYSPAPDAESADVLGRLIEGVHETLSLRETDMTIFYRRLANVPYDAAAEDDETLVERLSDAYYAPEQQTPEITAATASWLRAVLEHASGAEGANESLSNESRRHAMNRVNPKYVLRNYLAQMAIDKSEQGDDSMIHDLQHVLLRPYDEQPDSEELAAKRPDWARTRVGCSQLSCSS